MIYPPDQTEMFQVADHVAQGGLFGLPAPEHRPEPAPAPCASCGASGGRCDCNALGFEPLKLPAGVVRLDPLCEVCGEPITVEYAHSPGLMGAVHEACCPECCASCHNEIDPEELWEHPETGERWHRACRDEYEHDRAVGVS